MHAVCADPVDLQGPPVIQHARHWATNDSDAANLAGFIAHGNAELGPWYWIMVPMMRFDKRICLIQADRRDMQTHQYILILPASASQSPRT